MQTGTHFSYYFTALKPNLQWSLTDSKISTNISFNNKGKKIKTQKSSIFKFHFPLELWYLNLHIKVTTSHVWCKY